MSADRYRFIVGTFKCIAVSDGTHTYAPPTFPPPATFLFANAPRERLEQVLLEYNIQPEQWVEWVSPYICLVVNTGEHMVLAALEYGIYSTWVSSIDCEKVGQLLGLDGYWVSNIIAFGYPKTKREVTPKKNTEDIAFTNSFKNRGITL